MKKTYLNPKTIVVPAGAEKELPAYGRLWLVESANAAIGITWDDNNEFASFKTGLCYALEPGETFQKLRFKNTGGSDVTVSLLIGNGEIFDYRKEFSLDGATIAALASAINESIELKIRVVTLNVGDPPQTFSGCKSIEVLAAAGGDYVTLTSPSGLNFQLPSGVGKELSCETDLNHIEDLTVTPSATCGAEVTALYL